MRGVPNSILSKLALAPLVLPLVLAGCSDRDLRPLTPCTTNGASGNVPIQSLKNVDLIFLVDNSNSMASEQAKLRAEFPNMIRALATGDTDGDGVADGPAVESLRVAVITSDMGVLGVGVTQGAPIQNCMAGADPATRARNAHYGDDGVFRTRTRSIPLGANCNFDATGGDDVIPTADLPEFLTFATPEGAALDEAALATFNDRVSCLTNVGIRGCVFEQQLEAMLKAITPSTEQPEGGPFHSATGDTAAALGHGDDPNTNNPLDADGKGWFRDDSLLALVMVSDEDDCSASTPDLFDVDSTRPGFDRDQGFPTRAQPRCALLEDIGLWPVARYIKGFMARRALSPGAFVFAAITGVPEDLTSGEYEGPGGSTLIRGTDNLDEILNDPRMTYRTAPGVNNVPDGALAFACEHFDESSSLELNIADAVNNSGTITGVTVVSQPTPFDGTSTYATGATTLTVASSTGYPSPGLVVTGPGIADPTYVESADRSGTGTYIVRLSRPTSGAGSSANLTFDDLEVVTNSAFALGATSIPLSGAPSDPIPKIGDSVTGPGIAAGTVVVSINDLAPYTVGISAPTTALQSTPVAITFGETRGPANGSILFGDGIPAGMKIGAVTNSGSTYTLSLEPGLAVTIAANSTVTLKIRDVEAVPARRAVRVAQGILGDPYFSNASISSICVDSFRPAMNRIIGLIQQNLRGSCLPRSLIRNAQNQVNCDVFVTMPPDTPCCAPGVDDATCAYASTAARRVEVPTGVADVDGLLEVCRMKQVSVTPADIGTNLSPTSGHGWFYDDYTGDADSCGLSTAYRVSFTKTDTTDDTPPQGARMSFSCAQPVQDGDLEIDINSPCNTGAGTACVFSSEAAGDEFALRYNLLNRNFTYATTADPSAASRFNCEFDSNTCQVACDSDAQCPGGYVCYDDPNDNDGDQGSMQRFCVNPVCGTN